VPLVAATVLPHPPLLVPEVAAGAAHELDGLRAACDLAVSRVLDASDVYVVVGSAEETRRFEEYAVSFTPWGGPGEPSDRPALPLSVAVGVWLLHGVPASVVTIDRSASPSECARFGEELTRPPSVGLIVLGDGSACRTLKAPGYLDPRAEPYDAAVTAALGKADTDALLALDPVLSAELLVAGRAPWQILAGAAAGREWTAEVLYDDAPYGVQYTVATWLPA
jgi:aromatic ring-opening dioxygenase LigB subunit